MLQLQTSATISRDLTTFWKTVSQNLKVFLKTSIVGLVLVGNVINPHFVTCGEIVPRCQRNVTDVF